MCGIFGAFSKTGAALTDNVITAMSQSIEYRGPDADGVDVSNGVVIGNRRLSLIDLSSASDQPLYSDDRQIALVQNGEIYNYVELRKELKSLGHTFHTTGDTEVLVRAFEAWGPDFARHLNGMFAIAVHDKRDGTLWLVRDRLGVKPLFLAETPDQILFGSEIKALLQADLPVRPDMTALSSFLALNYIPPPQTAFDGVRHLMPGHVARITADGVTTHAFWQLTDVTPDPAMTEEAGKAELLDLLDDATRIRLRADAPYGAFLSGGLDSSSVVAHMRNHIDGDLRTYSIGFADPRFDESTYAAQVADMFGTIHTNQMAEPDITSLWPRFIWHCDQPHGDVSFMPMDLVSRLAAEDVKMVLTGDGGDELFAGYEKYLGTFKDGRTDLLEPGWEDGFAHQTGLLSRAQADALLTGPLAEAYRDTAPHAAIADAIRAWPEQDLINRVLYAETSILLPGNNLVKPDRMAMASSLEVRAPFLDYRMVEFAFRMPGALKLAMGETKAIYKAAMAPTLGQDLTYRRKQMFTVPIGEWFKDALAGFCRSLLLDGRFADRGLIAADALEALVEDHISGRANHTRQVRALISLEIWFRLFIDCDADMRDAATR